jgi:EAL domain-containing protein (putative c-di-GMP-specific phosphodiesterase class I)
MFGNKTTSTAKARKSVRKINHELEMLDYARRMGSGRNKASAVVVKLSRAAGFNYDNYLYAVNMFRELVSRFNGRLFILSNRDLVFGYQGPPGEPAVKDAVYKIRLLFNVGGDDAGGTFADWYDLELDADRFVDYATKVLERRRPDEEAAPATAVGDQPAEPSGEGAEEPAVRMSGGGAPVDVLPDLIRLMSRTDLAPLIRRQPIYRVDGQRTPHPFTFELYVSITDLEQLLPKGFSLTGDRYLFQYAMHALDKSVLRFLTRQMQFLPAANFTLNANVATLLSREFQDFDAVLSDEQRRSIILELPAIDVMGDLGTFLVVAEGIRAKGYRLCLDGLSPFTMPYFRLQDLAFDLFKIAWSPDLVEEHDAEQHTLLQGVVMRCGADRMVLCHCDSEHALRFGQQFGISLYQGRLLDQLLKTG